MLRLGLITENVIPRSCGCPIRPRESLTPAICRVPSRLGTGLTRLGRDLMAKRLSPDIAARSQAKIDVEVRNVRPRRQAVAG